MSTIEKKDHQLAGRTCVVHRCQSCIGRLRIGERGCACRPACATERDAAVERWLREDVAASYDAMKPTLHVASTRKRLFRNPRAPCGAIEERCVKRRRVIVAPEARDDLLSIYDWIATAASPNVALSYIERLEAWCTDLTWLPSAVMPAMTSSPGCASPVRTAGRRGLHSGRRSHHLP